MRRRSPERVPVWRDALDAWKRSGQTVSSRASRDDEAAVVRVFWPTLRDNVTASVSVHETMRQVTRPAGDRVPGLCCWTDAGLYRSRSGPTRLVRPKYRTGGHLPA